jgi:hypothetical protein
MFAQPFYTVDIFPYDHAITTWTNKLKKGFSDLMFSRKQP